MANQWLRLWHEMPNDPKWRTIARNSGQSIGNVTGVYLHLLVSASNATERGRTQPNKAEDIATALDISTQEVESILAAMQGRVLDGDLILGWEKRQPEREDGSADRAKYWREKKKLEERIAELESLINERTQPNATERNRTLDKDKEEKRVVDKSTRLPADWHPSEEDTKYCKENRPDLRPSEVAERFYDYWIAQPGVKGRKADWQATWRTWVRNEKPGTLSINSEKIPRREVVL